MGGFDLGACMHTFCDGVSGISILFNGWETWSGDFIWSTKTKRYIFQSYIERFPFFLSIMEKGIPVFEISVGNMGRTKISSQSLWYYGSMVLVGSVEQSRARYLFVWVSVSCSWCWVSWACVFGAILKYMMDICGFFCIFLHCVLDVIRSNVIIIYFWLGRGDFCVYLGWYQETWVFLVFGWGD